MLLVFYPLDFSPVCTDQLSVYQEVKPRDRGEGRELVGVSVDSPYAHKAFQEKLGIDFPLLADFEPKGEVSRAYDAYYDGAGHGKRTLVLVDEEGVVRVGPRVALAARGPGRQPDLRRAPGGQSRSDRRMAS